MVVILYDSITSGSGTATLKAGITYDIIVHGAGGGGGSNGENMDGQAGINNEVIASTGTVLIAPPTVTTSGGGGGGGAVAGANGTSSESDFTGGTTGQSYTNVGYSVLSDLHYGDGGVADIKGTDGYVIITTNVVEERPQVKGLTNSNGVHTSPALKHLLKNINGKK